MSRVFNQPAFKQLARIGTMIYTNQLVDFKYIYQNQGRINQTSQNPPPKPSNKYSKVFILQIFVKSLQCTGYPLCMYACEYVHMYMILSIYIFSWKGQTLSKPWTIPYLMTTVMSIIKQRHRTLWQDIKREPGRVVGTR